MSELHDLLFNTPETTPEGLGEISRLCQLLAQRKRMVADIEQQLKAAKDEMRKIEEEALPEAMRGLNIQSLTLEDGSTVEVKPFYRGHINEENKPDALAWLRQQGHADLIRHEFVFTFGKNQESAATMFRDFMRTWNGPKGKSKEVEGVHHSTLNAFVKEQMEDGVQLPDSISVFAGNRAVVKPSKR